MIHRPLHMTETTFSVRMQYTRLEMLQVCNYDISFMHIVALLSEALEKQSNFDWQMLQSSSIYGT